MGKSKSDKDRGSEFITKKEDHIQEKSYLAKEIQTSIALLESPENNIVLEALLFLSKYGDIKDENILYLQLHGIIPKVLKLLNRNVCILRMSLRLISILLKIDETVYELDQDIYNEKILKIAEMFMSHPDEYVREFCFPILSRLATSNRITCLIFSVDLFTPVYSTLEEAEKGSLIKDALDLVYILLNAPAAIVMLPDLSFDPLLILKHLDHPDVEIQNKVLEVIRKLTFYQIEAIQAIFQQARLVEKMITMLIDDQMKRHRKKALSIIMNCMESDQTNTQFINTLEFIKLNNWVKSCPLELLPSVSDIFCKITSIPELRQVLFDLSVEDSILSFFRSSEKKVLNNTCQAITNLSEHTYCCQRMLTPVVLKEILAILRRNDLDIDPENEVALKTLHGFAVRNYVETIQMLMENNGLSVILDYLKKGTENLTEESFSKVLHMLNMISVHPACEDSMLNDGFFEEIFKHLSNPYIEVVKAATEILINFIPLEIFRNYFIRIKGAEFIIKLLKQTKCKQILKGLLVFIHSILAYREIADEFLRNKIVVAINELPELIRSNVPLFDRILKIIYNMYLPIKFHETGRIDVMNKLESRFYIITGRWSYPFVFLEVYETLLKCPINTIYVVDYSNIGPTCEDTASFSSVHTLESAESLEEMVNFKLVPYDPYLPRYIAHIQKYIRTDMCLPHKVKLLAEYVETLLCGPDPEALLPQKLHHFKLHHESLKEKLSSNVIPVGYLRLGFHCERALLFKAIADKVGIPTSFVKGRNKIYWNEVILIKEYDDCDVAMCCRNLCVYIVDLMDKIGELLPVGSKEANAYCQIYD